MLGGQTHPSLCSVALTTDSIHSSGTCDPAQVLCDDKDGGGEKEEPNNGEAAVNVGIEIERGATGTDTGTCDEPDFRGSG